MVTFLVPSNLEAQDGHINDGTMMRKPLSLFALFATVGGFGEALHGQTLLRPYDDEQAVLPPIEAVSTVQDPVQTPIQTTAFPVDLTFTVLPNPAVDVLVISPNRDIAGFILGAFLQDATGQTVESGLPHGSNGVALGVGHLPRGVYHLTIRTADGSFVRRVDLI